MNVGDVAQIQDFFYSPEKSFYKKVLDFAYTAYTDDLISISIKLHKVYDVIASYFMLTPCWVLPFLTFQSPRTLWRKHVINFSKFERFLFHVIKSADVFSIIIL